MGGGVEEEGRVGGVHEAQSLLEDYSGEDLTRLGELVLEVSH